MFPVNRGQPHYGSSHRPSGTDLFTNTSLVFGGRQIPPASPEMALAETIENVRETRGEGNSPLPPHTSCCMELPQPFQPWSGLLSTITTGTLHPNHYLHPLKPLYLQCPLPVDSADSGQSPQLSPVLPPSLTMPPSQLCKQRDGMIPSSFPGSGEDSGSHREEQQDAYSQQWHLPDLLPQNEQPPCASLCHRATRRKAVQAFQIRKVAIQLRAIGDEFNTRVVCRANGVSHWQEWRDICRGILSFITQTLSALYTHT